MQSRLSARCWRCCRYDPQKRELRNISGVDSPTPSEPLPQPPGDPLQSTCSSVTRPSASSTASPPPLRGGPIHAEGRGATSEYGPGRELRPTRDIDFLAAGIAKHRCRDYSTALEAICDIPCPEDGVILRPGDDPDATTSGRRTDVRGPTGAPPRQARAKRGFTSKSTSASAMSSRPSARSATTRPFSTFRPHVFGPTHVRRSWPRSSTRW